MTYWEERAIESVKRMDGALDGYTSELTQSFENAKKQLQSEINIFYGKYADENKITFVQAQKELSFAELRNFKGDLKEYEKLAKNSIGTYDLTVSNLSKKARITRLQALHMQCDTILQKLYQQQKTTIEEISKRLYIEQYYQKQFDIEQYIGFQFNFVPPSLDSIKKVLAMPVNGVDISTSLWRQDVDTGFKIRQTLNEMFITGKPPQAFSQNLQKIIGRRDENGNLTGKKYEAYRLLYNESSFVTEQSALQAYKDDEVDEYEIIATLDFKTSPICQHEDGKHYPVKLAVTGVNYPPFHVNCRTTTGPYIGDLKEFSSTRMARNENGESVQVKNQTYQEWYNGKIGKFGKEKIIADEKMIKNRNADQKQYNKYKDLLGKDAPISLAKFQDLKYNDISQYEDLKGLYHYKNENPNSDKKYYEIDKALKHLRENKSIRAKGEAVRPNQDISIIEANGHTEIRFAKRNLTINDAIEFKKNAVVALKQRLGTQYQYYSTKGFVVVNLDGIIQSIGSLDEAGELLVKEVLKYV